MEMAPNKVDQGSRAPVMRNGMGWAREGRAHSGPIRKLIKKQIINLRVASKIRAEK
jgi:hypothetical protein